MTIALLIAAAIQTPTVINQPVADQPVPAIVANETYLMVRAATAMPVGMAFFREADAADIQNYRQRRAQALAKLHAKWVTSRAEWPAELREWEKAEHSNRGPRPEQPIEPNDATLDFPTIEQEGTIFIGPLNRFMKDKTQSAETYLSKVRPGRYVFYGPMIAVANAPATGSCTCMGTIAFDVAPGKITDAGTLQLNLFTAMAAAKDGTGPKIRDDFDLPPGVTTVGWVVPNNATPIDTRLHPADVVRATLHSSGPYPNWFKAQVERLTAVPGVLAYERDRIIDLQQPATQVAK